MLESGTFLADRYEIIEKVGAGGMSDVYRAKDHVLDRDVAIKVLKQEFTEDMSFVTKFRTEAQSAAGLEHPNIVNIYDVGSEDGLYYIVMEFVEGITLKTYIEKKGQLNYKEVISIAIQVGRGIEAAHKKDIIHRDIKPQNIIISKEGKVKVTDFGIARAASGNTIKADVMGSVHYVSPEQARNGYVTAQSDIYSLGIVMYEMATGRVPFDGETTVAVAIQHLQGEMTPPSTYAPDLPISVEKIIQKATMKSPDRRYATMGDLLVDLKKALISPDDDFVTIQDQDAQDKTRVITEDELEQIKQNAKNPEEEEEEEEKVNPKMEKAISIMAIAAGIIIVAIVIFLIGSFLGLFNFKAPSSKKTETKTTQSSKSSTSTSKVTVPDLLGKTEAQAKAALKNAGLGYKNNGTEASEDYDEGQICDQSVNSGTKVAKNTTVKVKISSGKGEIAIPSVVGKTEAEAKSTLTDAGFKTSSNYQYSDSVAAGSVISQSPSANAKGKKGDTVTLVVSQGKQTVQVPNVVGLTQAAAESQLKSQGFTITENFTTDSQTAGTVISQDVAAGKYVDAGSTITIAISSGKAKYAYTVSLPSGAGYYVLTESNGTTHTGSSSGTVSDMESSSGSIEYYADSTKATLVSSTSSVNFTQQ